MFLEMLTHSLSLPRVSNAVYKYVHAPLKSNLHKFCEHCKQCSHRKLQMIAREIPMQNDLKHMCINLDVDIKFGFYWNFEELNRWMGGSCNSSRFQCRNRIERQTAATHAENHIHITWMRMRMPIRISIVEWFAWLKLEKVYCFIEIRFCVYI